MKRELTMPLTITETVVRNQERKRRFLRARRERKSVTQVVSEEGQGRLAQKLVQQLLPSLSGELSEELSQSFRAALRETAAAEESAAGKSAAGESAGGEGAPPAPFSRELAAITTYLGRIAQELGCLRLSLDGLAAPKEIEPATEPERFPAYNEAVERMLERVD